MEQLIRSLIHRENHNKSHEAQNNDDIITGEEGNPNSLNTQILKACNKLRHVIPPMPQEITDISLYLEQVDKIFRDYNVTDYLKRHVIEPHLTPQIRKAIVSF